MANSYNAKTGKLTCESATGCVIRNEYDNVVYETNGPYTGTLDGGLLPEGQYTVEAKPAISVRQAEVQPPDGRRG